MPANMKVTVKIENIERTIELEPGGNMRKALLENGIQLYASNQEHLNCHGLGGCTRCQIEVVEGPGLSDQSMYERLRVGTKRRLACQMRVYQDSVIRTLHQAAPVD